MRTPSREPGREWDHRGADANNREDTSAVYRNSAVESFRRLSARIGNRAMLALAIEAGRGSRGDPERISSELGQAIQRRRGGGSPLSSAAREGMEEAFGHDFSAVRVHTDGASDTLSRALRARAFTVGRDIFFRNSAFSASSNDGRRLLAHELAHVVQHGGASGAPETLSRPGGPLERAADSAASAALEAADSALRPLNRDAFAAARERAGVGRSPDPNGGESCPAPEGISPALLYDRIGDMRVENVMILYADSFDPAGGGRAFYNPRSWVGAARRAYPYEFLSCGPTRRLLRQTFRNTVEWLVSQGDRWETLYWLYEDFPNRYLAGAPDVPLRQMRAYIERRARMTPFSLTRSGWDVMQQTPVRRHEQAWLEGLEEGSEQRAFQSGIRALRRGLHRTAGVRAYRIIFSTEAAREVGGHAHGLPRNWAEALVRYLRTINELRKGRSPSASEPIADAPLTATAHMVGGAADAWRSLTEEQREALADEEQWRRAVGQLWPAVIERIEWGLERGGYDITVEMIYEGAFLNPPQSVY